MATNKFKAGDRVRVKDNYFNSAARGKEGTVKEVNVSNVFLEGMFTIKLDDGRIITLVEESLVLVPQAPVEAQEGLKEGERIELKDIKVGQIVRVSIVSQSGDYEQVSSKQGKVTKVTKTWGVTEVWVASNSTDVRLDYGKSSQFFTLIKNAPKVDEITEALKALKPGSVVQVEDDGAGEFKLTFIKSATNGSLSAEPLWLFSESRYSYSNTISESAVRKKVTSLDQIVVKH
jgi:hypothetical protein